MKVSYVITAKSKDDPKLAQLLRSVSEQVGIEKETHVITEGTSESAKAIGIARATHPIICILASDNEFTNPFTSYIACKLIEEQEVIGAYPRYYYYSKSDPLLNRYFSLLGCNDPLAYYMRKADRFPLDEEAGHGFIVRDFKDSVPTLGDNAFFIKRDCITRANLTSYYHIDVCEDLRRQGLHRYAEFNGHIWHKTGDGSLFNFFRRRARFGAQHAFNRDRRWHLVNPRELPRLCFFIIAASTLLHPAIRAVKGYTKIKDPAWFLHPLICLLTVLTYACLMIRLWVSPKSVLSFVHMKGQRV